MVFRFVHSADIHLDSPLKSLALRNQALADLVGAATREAFTRIIDLCVNEKVDALLLAGDLYDGEQNSMSTARFLATELERLEEAGVKTFIIKGNHDAESKITRQLQLPDSVTTFRKTAGAVRIDRASGPPVVVHGLSFPTPQVPYSLLPAYKPPVEGAINIGLMHASLNSAPGHDLYAPCSDTELDAHGFDYWALGHIHKRAVYGRRCAIVMPGMPQGRDIGESGLKSATLARIDDDGSVHLEERPTCIAQFERVDVDLTGEDNWSGVNGRVAEAVAAVRNAAKADHLIACITLTGETPLAWRARRDKDLLKTQAEQNVQQLAGCWIDKFEVDCAPPPRTGASAGADPVAELEDLIAADIVDSDAYVERIRELARKLLPQLPRDLRSMFGDDEKAFNEAIDDLARRGVKDVISRL